MPLLFESSNETISKNINLEILAAVPITTDCRIKV